jgi:serine-type D-Ala-D-Ala carboxypeptidase
MFSTAHDLAAFGRMILNRGRYGSEQIVSAASVSEVIRNQTPGISAFYKEQVFPESSWGLGWDVHSNKRSFREPSLFSPAAVSHGAAGGCFFWIDPAFDVVGIFLSVNVDAETGTDSRRWRGDLFANAVTATVEN